MNKRRAVLQCILNWRLTAGPAALLAAEKAHDSRGMDVMGTLDLSIQGWFINPVDLVSICVPCCCASCTHMRWQNHHLRFVCLDRKYARGRMAPTGCSARDHMARCSRPSAAASRTWPSRSCTRPTTSSWRSSKRCSRCCNAPHRRCAASASGPHLQHALPDAVSHTKLSSVASSAQVRP